MARTSSSFLALPVTKVTAFGSTRAAADMAWWWEVPRVTPASAGDGGRAKGADARDRRRGGERETDGEGECGQFRQTTRLEPHGPTRPVRVILLVAAFFFRGGEVCCLLAKHVSKT